MEQQQQNKLREPRVVDLRVVSVAERIAKEHGLECRAKNEDFELVNAKGEQLVVLRTAPPSVHVADPRGMFAGMQLAKEGEVGVITLACPMSGG